jgi:diacylglycerol kinase
MKSQIQAFGHAFNGFRVLLTTQIHAKFHLAATAVVVGAAIYVRVARQDWIILTLCITSVWAAEALNTAIEALSDEVSLEWRERIKHAKDVAAFCVLVTSIGAGIAGVLVFYPYIIK